MFRYPRLLMLAAVVFVGGVIPSLSAQGTDKLRVLIVDGQNNHNWRATTPVMKKALEDSGRFTVAVSSNLKQGEKPGSVETVPFPPDLSKYDVVMTLTI